MWSPLSSVSAELQTDDCWKVSAPVASSVSDLLPLSSQNAAVVLLQWGCRFHSLEGGHMSCHAVVIIGVFPSWPSDVQVSWLETVIPKRSGSLVLVVKGRHKGKVSKNGV